jgi:transposase-like protein
MSHQLTASTITSDNGQGALTVPDPEVVVKAKRRYFTAEYKLRILQEAATCRHDGEVGALLRREGLYSSHLTTWRAQRRRGELQGLASKKRGRPADPHAAELARLRQENERLQTRLQQAETIIEVQKKLSCLLGPPPTASDDSK